MHGINFEKEHIFIKLLQMKKLHLLALVALIMLGLSGCEKATVENIAAADVFVKAIKNAQGETVYVPIHSVFSYNKMTSVSVTSPSGTSTSLINYENGGNSFYNEPADADYLTTQPAVGTYTYTVKFDNGEEKTYTNSLSDSKILPANITSLTKTANGDSVYIYWDAIANVDFYQIKIQKGTTQILYADGLYDSSSPKKQNLRMGFLLSNLISNSSGIYTFEIAGKLYETIAHDYLQALSSSTKDITL